MKEESYLFCKVCAGVVADGLRTALGHGGRPDGGGAPGGSNLVSLTVRRQADGSGAVIGVAPARLPFTLGTTVPGRAAHAAWSGDQIVGAAPVGAVGTHGFGHPGPDGEMHQWLPDQDDVYEIRVPAESLAGDLHLGQVVLGEETGGLPLLDAVRHPTTSTVAPPRLVRPLPAAGRT